MNAALAHPCAPRHKVVLTKKAAQNLGGILSRRCIRLGSDRFRIVCNINVATVFGVLRIPVGIPLRRRPQLIAGMQLYG